MKRHELEIEILEDGTLSIEVHGVKGEECVELTSALEEALGDVVQRDRKAAFYEESEDTNRSVKDWSQS